MGKLKIQGIAFDMYGSVVDVGAVAEACKAIAPDAVAFNNQWRAKQLEYTFLRSTLGKYQDFWKVSEQALEFTVHRFGLSISPEQRKHLMEAWLDPTPYPDVAGILPRLKERYPLAILSNATPNMLKTGVDRAALRPHFRRGLSADTVRIYKPSPRMSQLTHRSI